MHHKSVEISDNINDMKDERQKDNGIKKLFRNTNLLAEFAKNFIAEYKDMPIEDIKLYINPRGTEEVMPINTESSTPYFQKIRFDTLFELNAPGRGDMMVKILMGIEGEFREKNTKRLRNRMKFYSSDMIVNQKSIIFDGNRYEDMEKVFSIWVIMNPRADKRNSVHMYYTETATLDGDPSTAETMDLENIVVINLGDPEAKVNSRTLRILNTIFKGDIDDEERNRVLSNEYDINIDLSLLKEAREFMDIEGELKYEHELGFEEGFEKGEASGVMKGEISGIKKGDMERLIKATKQLMDKKDMTFDEVVELLEIPEEDIEIIRRGLHIG